MNWKVAAVAILLAAVPVAVAQEDARFDLAGSFERDRTQADLDHFQKTVENHTGEGVALQESFPEQFHIQGLAADVCKALHRELDTTDYLARLSDCVPKRGADASGDAVSDEPARNETSDSSDAKPSGFERCNQLKGDERTRCINEYCQSPHERHADDCRKWQARQEDAGDREAIKNDFSVCKDNAETDGERHECAREHHDDIQEEQEQERLERQERIAQARADHKIGAELVVREGAEFDALQTMTGDVHTTLETIDARAGNGRADFRVTVSAELESGRTIVLDVDPSVLSGPQLVVRYFDVFDDGTETEVIIRQADDLDDILDPDDDGGQPEYWIVQDSNGIQMMASIPHWSTHALTVQGIGEVVTSPSVIAGIVLGVVGTSMAAAVMFWPRRD